MRGSARFRTLGDYRGVLIALSIAACGGEAEEAPRSLDPALVGDWTGMTSAIDAAGGTTQRLTMSLRADGFMRAEGETGAFCLSEGEWFVVDGQFRGVMTTSCFGNTLSFRAPISSTRLDGTWSTNRAGGTFDVSKR
ncbi:MAG: hypothetical protein AAFU79_08710 [Myxococcota bacterium]